MTIQVAYQELLKCLSDVYEQREAANITDLVIEHVTGQRKIDRITNKNFLINVQQQEKLGRMTTNLLTNKPVQYVLGEAWFMNMKLLVNEHVLIPRPETEELVDWIIRDVDKKDTKEISLIDIGTGSGCIPITIKKMRDYINTSAIDVSNDALDIAKTNSSLQNTVINFQLINFLNETEWNQLGKYNIIVSNPPYIKSSEAISMSDNVVNFEPHIALFVPDHDAFIFYKNIAKFGMAHLKKDGHIYAEINEALGEQVIRLFETYSYKNIELRKDMQGKDRRIKVSIG